MPLFRRGEWPRDHRDEFVAGALVGAVVIVLGYASGIGTSTTPGAPEAATPPSSPPAATAPPIAAPGDPAAQAPGGGWMGQVPVGAGELPVFGDTGTGDGTAGNGSHGGHGGHGGQGASPAPTPTLPPPAASMPPSPSPSDSGPPSGDGACADGEVRLVAPLLTGITQPLFGLLNGTDTGGTDTGGTGEETPEPTASPCIGLPPLSALLGGSGSASPLPEATP